MQQIKPDEPFYQISQAAKLLDISRRNLYNKLEVPTDNSNA